MSSTPQMMALLSEKIKEWHNEGNYVIAVPKDSALDLIIIEFKPAGITLGDANLVMTGLKKGIDIEASAELQWEGYIRRRARFEGPDADVLNSDDKLMDLIKILEPVSAGVTTRRLEDRNDLFVTLTVRYVPSVGLKTKLLALIKALEIIYADVVSRRVRQLLTGLSGWFAVSWVMLSGGDCLLVSSIGFSEKKISPLFPKSKRNLSREAAASALVSL